MYPQVIFLKRNASNIEKTESVEEDRGSVPTSEWSAPRAITKDETASRTSSVVEITAQRRRKRQQRAVALAVMQRGVQQP